MGRTPGELDLWPELSDRDLMLQTLSQEGAVRDFESKVRRKSGEIRDTLTSFVMVDIGGEPCILGMVSDVTERKRAEGALRESEQRFRQVLDVSSDMVFKLNLDSDTYEYVSPSVLQLTGFAPEEFATLRIRGVRRRVHPDDWPQYRREIAEFVDVGSDSYSSPPL